MRAEQNLYATKLKSLITALSTLVSPKEWVVVSLVLADAIAEIGRLSEKNRELRERVRDLSSEVEYWQRRADG